VASGALTVAIAVCGLAAAPAAWSQEAAAANTFEITPFVGWMAGGSFEEPGTKASRDVEDDTSFGIFLNLATDVPARQYELLYAKQSSVVEGAAPMDLDLQYLHIGGTVGYPQSAHVIPYFGATIGAARFTPDLRGLDDETKLSFSIGGGVRFPITQRFGIRFDVRAFITLLENDSEIFCVSDPPSAGCLIKPKSDTFVQYTGSLGVSFGF
jgi:opacity protein-like surface antigen